MTLSLASGGPARRISAWLLTWILLAGVATPPATARAAQPAGAAPAEALPSEQARDLFRQGRARYDVGDYPAAVQLFERAYQLAPVPDLLFGIAQAHRLHGDCRRALAVYRTFLRKSHETEKLHLARDHEARLAQQCETPLAEPPDRWSGGQIAATSALVAGLGTLLAAGALSLWNEGRNSTWQREQDWLEGPDGKALPPMESVRRQNANDLLLDRIQSADRLAITLAIVGGAAAVAGGATFWWLRRRKVRFEPGLSGLRLTVPF
jgi:hypothetical protein